MIEELRVKINSHEKILTAVANSIKALIDESDYIQAIHTCLALLGQATGVDRVYMFQNVYDQDGTGKTYQSLEWNSGVKVAQIENPELQALPFSDIESFIEPLKQDKAFYGVVRNFEDDRTRELLEEQEVLSIVVLPIFVKKVFWGFIGFDECKTERLWNESEFSALVAFSGAVESAIERSMILEELKNAKSNAESANVMKSHFLANMSHEIRTPMNGIMGFAHLLQRTPLTIEQNEYVLEIKAASEMLLLLINDILDLSKIEAGRMELERTRFSIRKLIENALLVFMPKLSKKGVELKVAISEDVPDEVLGDSVRIRQVLHNLVDNALKFTDKGTVTISVNCDKLGNQRIKLNFEVKDSGIGIDENNLKRLFRPFTQADSSTTRQFGGTGLGLAICKELVRLMDGEISVDSQLGLGSTFKFYVQLENLSTAVLSNTLVAHQENLIKQVIEEQSDYNNLSVLVAEDNEMNRKVILKLLKVKGIVAEFAINGLEAFEAVQKKDYDLVFMDCQMPVMDGYECTARIRGLGGKKSKTIVIAMTANAMEGDEEKCLQSGMDDYVSKPLDFSQVLALLERYIQLKKSSSVISYQQMIEMSIKRFIIDTGLREEDATELFLDYESELPKYVKQMEAFLELVDYKSIQEIAHQLKGSSGSLRVTPIYEISMELEEAAKAEDFNLLQSAYERLLSLTQA
jgi:signal transduction histidine kinase/CheY-like chemotaxis protein/HPt (histidine-containing phosphotransfer) domain-containing protein